MRHFDLGLNGELRLKSCRQIAFSTNLRRIDTFGGLSSVSMAWSPSGKARVCKTCIRGSDSHPRLHQIPYIYM